MYMCVIVFMLVCHALVYLYIYICLCMSKQFDKYTSLLSDYHNLVNFHT